MYIYVCMCVWRVPCWSWRDIACGVCCGGRGEILHRGGLGCTVYWSALGVRALSSQPQYPATKHKIQNTIQNKKTQNTKHKTQNIQHTTQNAKLKVPTWVDEEEIGLEVYVPWWPRHDTALIRNTPLLGPRSRTTPRAIATASLGLTV